jgi:hypothetical protein
MMRAAPPTWRERQPRGREKAPMATTCAHLDQIRDVSPSADGCEDC